MIMSWLVVDPSKEQLSSVVRGPRAVWHYFKVGER